MFLSTLPMTITGALVSAERLALWPSSQQVLRLQDRFQLITSIEGKACEKT